MKKIFGTLGILAGAAMIVFGIIVMNISDTSTVDSYIKFGADFYTEQYHATARAANNLDRLFDAVKTGSGFLLIGLGSVSICYFGVKLGEDKKASRGSSVSSAPAFKNLSIGNDSGENTETTNE